MWWMGMKAVMGGISAFQQASEQRRETREQYRRVRLGHEQQLGAAEALAGASGIEESGSSSLTLHLNAMAEEFRRQEQWMLKAGMAQAAATEVNGLFAGMSDFGGGLVSAGQASNWWMQPAPGGGGHSLQTTAPSLDSMRGYGTW